MHNIHNGKYVYTSHVEEEFWKMTQKHSNSKCHLVDIWANLSWFHKHKLTWHLILLYCYEKSITNSTEFIYDDFSIYLESIYIYLVTKTIRPKHVIIHSVCNFCLAVWHITSGLNLVFMKANHSRLSALYFLLSIILTCNCWIFCENIFKQKWYWIVGQKP